MSIKVHIPTPMRQHTDGQAVVEAGGGAVQELLDKQKTQDGVADILEKPFVIAPVLEEFVPIYEWARETVSV